MAPKTIPTVTWHCPSCGRKSLPPAVQTQTRKCKCGLTFSPLNAVVRPGHNGIPV